MSDVDTVMEEAIARADGAVSLAWKEHYAEKIRETAKRLEFLTSEDVWESGLEAPKDGSKDGDALGPAMRRAAKAGIIESTDRFETKTKRAQRHKNPKRVWKSSIFFLYGGQIP